MFGIGFGEILVIGFLAFMLVGPKGLPDMAKQFGKWFVKFRRVTFEVKSGVDHFMRQAENELRDEELADLKKELSKLGHDVNQSVTGAVDGVKEHFVDPEAHLYPENAVGGAHHGDHDDPPEPSISHGDSKFETPLSELNPKEPDPKNTP